MPDRNLLYVNVVIVLYLLLCLALSVQPAGASSGCQLCMSSAQTTLTPFEPTSTPTALPTATPTPIILVPLRPFRAFLPIVTGG